jgi:hypothetical protein
MIKLILNNLITRAYAQVPPPLPGGGGAAGQPPSAWAGVGSLNELLGRILSFVFGLAGAIFVIMIIVGGLQYLTSAGNEEAAGKAKKLMTYAVIGIVITVAAWGISDLILKLVGGEATWFQ